MEEWYALRLEDDHVVDQQLETYNDLSAEAGTITSKISSSTKIVKNAVVPGL